MGAAAVPPTALWSTIAGPCSTLLAFTAGSGIPVVRRVDEEVMPLPTPQLSTGKFLRAIS